METITIATSKTASVSLLSNMLNRHGLIAGATGTGKTVSLQAIVDHVSSCGIPTVVSDIKGDLAGLSMAGGGNPKVDERRKLLGVTTPFAPSPTVFWDLFGEQGHPVRTTISDMGPLLLSRLLNLNDTQTGVLSIVFQIADDGKLLLLDLKDLRSLLTFVGENASKLTTRYGNVSKATIGSIQRGLLELEQQEGNFMFGEPAFDIRDFIQTRDGRGVVNVFAAERLMRSPKTYATFLLWLLSELFEELPEVGDVEKPKLVFFFDEAHLLFDDAPQVLIDKIEQVVRLIRSKGVGIFFITQNPIDVPDKILAQLGNRIQHALRAFTPRDQKAIRAMAQTFRTNTSFSVEEIITQLEVGEALISVLDKKGSPTPVERAYIIPPTSKIGTITPDERKSLIQSSAYAGKYDTRVDRESAYEFLQKRASGMMQNAGETNTKSDKDAGFLGSMMTTLARGAMSTVGRNIANQIVRGMFGNLLR